MGVSIPRHVTNSRICGTTANIYPSLLYNFRCESIVRVVRAAVVDVALFTSSRLR